MLIFVLGLSFLLLTLAFRSVVVAGLSIVLNLLSVGAAYGLLTLVFLHGVGASVFGFQQVTAIDAWVPLFLFSVLFALSMDYQVFLMSRIKERYDQTGSTREAVTDAVSSTARIITGAALIIVVVFSGFARGQLVMFQQMGFGVAAALLLDATLIRMVILPSVLSLLGYRSWYLPRWLRWVPHLEVEAPDARRDTAGQHRGTRSVPGQAEASCPARDAQDKDGSGAEPRQTQASPGRWPASIRTSAEETPSAPSRLITSNKQINP